jgi:regulator of nonsense transcripts 2
LKSTQPPIDFDDDQDDIYAVRDHKKDEVDKDAEEDFDREFAKMLADTTDVRRNETRKTAAPVFDSAVPLIKRKPAEQGVNGDSMQFTLLSKRGNKQHVGLGGGCPMGG